MKTASLIYFYFGDSYLTSLGQDTMNLGLAAQGYDTVRVLRFPDEKVGPFQLGSDIGNVVLPPTEDNFIDQLNDLGNNGYQVDLFLFTHGISGAFRTSKGTYGDNRWASGPYLMTKIKPLNLRAVWQCNCYGSTLNGCWQKLGAQVTAGSRYVDFYPTRWSGFMNDWLSGKTFKNAVDNSDTAAVHTPAQAYILADAAQTTADWGGMWWTAPTVLSKNDASTRYFTSEWLGSDYKSGLSGKDEMNHSSEMLIAGDGSIRK